MSILLLLYFTFSRFKVRIDLSLWAVLSPEEKSMRTLYGNKNHKVAKEGMVHYHWNLNTIYGELEQF